MTGDFSHFRLISLPAVRLLFFLVHSFYYGLLVYTVYIVYHIFWVVSLVVFISGVALFSHKIINLHVLFV